MILCDNAKHIFIHIHNNIVINLENKLLKCVHGNFIDFRQAIRANDDLKSVLNYTDFMMEF